MPVFSKCRHTIKVYFEQRQRTAAPKPEKTRLKSVTATFTAAILAAQTLIAPLASAQGKLPLVRDVETENLLRQYAKPIFRAAGLPAGQVEIILVNDKSFNAFVPDSRRMFINLGVILDAKTPGEVIGVLAHETGHIAGNHLVRMRQAAANAQIISVVGMILGAGAAAAGAAAGSGGTTQGGAAAAMSSSAIGQRSFLAYKRTEEASADQAALRYLERTKQSPKGMLKTFEEMADQALFSARYVDPYALSHPMPRERYNALKTKAQRSKYFNIPAPKALQFKHEMVRAKLYAFTNHPSTVLKAYPPKNKSLPAQYARAVASMQRDGVRKSVPKIDALIRKMPGNPYFYELKGQALLEGGKPKQAVAPFRKALQYLPGDPQLEVWLGYAMVASNDKSLLPQAKSVLQKALRKDPNSATGYAQLAIAAGRMGDTATADLATARSLLNRGDIRGAQRYAKRAKKKLKTGTPAWQMADDILTIRAN
ncbi:M48 family metalloprotease [Polycladidibacter hongkongensis]|uniref:M48 family metalloprotease n=1 Tax=Polycladidibacter hongkongensis TaxID=1647556 RepID=UPI0009E69A04|nr:M48 family metalloprotease [Pseudovibrio hongkongensis]